MTALKRSRLEPSILVSAVDDYFGKLLPGAEKPLRLDSLKRLQQVQSEASQGALANHPLRTFVLPRFDRCFLTGLHAIASLRATAIILLLHEYYQEKGEWPTSLSEIDFGEHPDFVNDLFSEKSFVYKSNGETFLLYSVGHDGIDNNAKHGDWDGWYPSETNTDFVFWPVQK